MMGTIVVVMVVVVPVFLSVPTVIVFTPPAMIVFPAIVSGLGKFFAITLGLRTIPAMVLGSFVKLVVSTGDAFLTIVVSAQWSRNCEEKERHPARMRRAHGERKLI